MQKTLLLLIAFALPAVSQQKDEYVIQPGDTLMLRVWRQPDLSGSLVVRPSGDVRVPEVGVLHVAGMLTTEMATLCERELTRTGLKQSQVMVMVQSRANRKQRQGPVLFVPASN